MSEDKEQKTGRKIVIGGQSGISEVAPPPSEELSSGENLGDVSEAKANKRLSNETLFAFALPESVLEEAVEAAKKGSAVSQKAAPKPEPVVASAPLARETTSKATSSKAISKEPGSDGKKLNPLGALIVGMLIAVLFVFAGRFAGEISEYLSSKTSEVDVAAGTGQSIETSQDEVETVKQQVVQEEQPVEARSSETVNNVPSQALETVEVVSSEEASVVEALRETLSSDEVVLDARLSSSDVPTIVAALKEVSEKKPSRLTKRLVEISANPNDSIRALVVRLFVDKSYIVPDADRSAVVSMILSRLNDRDEIVRGFSAKALSVVGDESAIPALEARLGVEKSELVLKLLRSSVTQLKRQAGK